MTVNQFVDELIEAGPVDPGEFLSGFPMIRAGGRDLLKVINRLVQLKADHGGQWSETGDVRITVLDTPIEKIAKSPDSYDLGLDNTALYFRSVVVRFDGTIVGPGQADYDGESYYGWTVYVRFNDTYDTSFVCLKISPVFGAFKAGQIWFEEETLPEEVAEVCFAHYEKFFKEFIEPALWVNERLTEAEKGSSPKGWEQIGGDFGDPWTYGGTWFNKELDEIIHFPGVESEDYDVEPDSERVDSRMTYPHYRAIVAELSLENTFRWEKIEDDLRQEQAELIKEELKFSYYRTTCESNEWIERDWAREIAEIKQELEMSDEEWAALPPCGKEEAIANRIGWYEFDSSPEKISRGELSNLLGIQL